MCRRVEINCLKFQNRKFNRTWQLTWFFGLFRTDYGKPLRNTSLWSVASSCRSDMGSCCGMCWHDASHNLLMTGLSPLGQISRAPLLHIPQNSTKYYVITDAVICGINFLAECRNFLKKSSKSDIGVKRKLTLSWKHWRLNWSCFEKMKWITSESLSARSGVSSWRVLPASVEGKCIELHDGRESRKRLFRCEIRRARKGKKDREVDIHSAKPICIHYNKQWQERCVDEREKFKRAYQVRLNFLLFKKATLRLACILLFSFIPQPLERCSKTRFIRVLWPRVTPWRGTHPENFILLNFTAAHWRQKTKNKYTSMRKMRAIWSFINLISIFICCWKVLRTKRIRLDEWSTSRMLGL